MRIARNQFLAVFVLIAVAAGAWVQATVTAGDLTRLETTASDIDKQVTTLRRTDPTLAGEVAKSLGDAKDEIAYLRVKMRREGSVTRAEYADVRDRLETLRIKATGEKVFAQPVEPDRPDRSNPSSVVPVATEFDVRLQTPLTSKTAKVEQRFEATTVLDYSNGRDVLIPAGSLVRGFVSSVKPAGRIDRTGSLTLSFDEIVVNGQSQRLRASVVKALDPKISDDVTRIGAGAAVGAAIGGILGGGKGALVGVLIGGGGTIASSEGTDVDLPAGTLLRIRLDQPLDLGR
jgi:hypothetical protein